MPKAKRERTPAQIAAFEKMQAAQRAKILREAGVTSDPPAAPPASPPAEPARTYRARSSSKAKAKASSSTRRRSTPASAQPSAPAPAPTPSDDGGGFWRGLREGFGT